MNVLLLPFLIICGEIYATILKKRIMKVIIPLILTIFSLFISISAQSVLERDFFTLPSTLQFQKHMAFDIGDVHIESTGNGNVWDFSQVTTEQLDVIYTFEKYLDPDSRFRNATFTVTSREGGSTVSGFELFSLTDGVLLFRGIGTIDENGKKELDQFGKPLRILIFPWIMGESFYSEHPIRNGTRTLSAKGTLILPGEESKVSYKFTESYQEGNEYYIEHTWYTDVLPYPILIIKDKFNQADSSLLLRSVDMLKARSSVSSKDKDDVDFINNMPIFNNGLLHIPSGCRLKSVFGLNGQQLAFSEVSNGDFIIPQASQTLFIVYIDTKQQLHSHIIQLVQ